MTRLLPVVLLAFAPVAAWSAPPPPPRWSFDAPLGGFDLGAAQRGLGVFRQRCASCHGMASLEPADLLRLGLDDRQADALLHELGGSPFAGRSPSAGQGGAPDLSRTERVRGADALWRLLLAPNPSPAYNGLPPGHPVLRRAGEARDLVTFLAWAAWPHLTERRQLGVAILLFGLLALGVAGLAGRRNPHG